MRTPFFRRTAVLAFLLLLTAGCGGAADGPAADAQAGDERPLVALVMKSLANEFFVTMAEGAEAHHAAHDDAYDLIVTGIKDETDIAQQVALIEQMQARGVDAIVLAPADSRALVPVVARVMEAGIVVVNIDNKLDAATLAEEGIRVPFVGPDNRAGARLVGEELARHLQPGDRVLILEGVPTTFNAQQRRQGFEEAMQAAGIVVADVQSGMWEQAKGNAVAAAMLSAHPDVKAILASNDNMALGAAAAVKQAGREQQVVIVGFDNIQAIHGLMQEGRVLATADQHADRLAVYGIDYALQILAGEAMPEDRQTPVDLITPERLAAHVAR